jgi:hypothetical protein
MTFVQEKRKDFMIIYSVTVAIQASIESEWVDWMTRVHVPDVLRTDCFSDCRIYKLLGSDDEGPTYVMQYECRSVEQYHRYRDNFAPALQNEHADRFGGHFRGSRQLLEEIAPTESRERRSSE